MKFPRPLFALGACAVVLAACEDIPVLPQWDAEWYLPLPSQNLSFRTMAGGVPSIPNGTSYGFTQDISQPVDEAMGQILGTELKAATIILRLTKTINLYAFDTLFVANSTGGLVPGNPNGIMFPLSLTTADRTVEDTLVVTAGALNMLRTTAENNGTLYIRLSGRAGNNSGSPVTVATTDSLGARIAVIARIPVSK